MRRQGLEREAIPQTFLSDQQRFTSFMDVVVPTTSPFPLQLASAVSAEIGSLSKDVSISEVTTMDQRLGNSISERRFQTLLYFLFSGAALLLASSGFMASPIIRSPNAPYWLVASRREARCRSTRSWRCATNKKRENR